MKGFCNFGKIICLLLVACGLLVMVGVLGGDTSSPGSAGYMYDSGYASFGADFYTYVSNNAAEAASGARTAAYNLQDIAVLLKNVCGIFLMGFGLIGFCAFGAAGAAFKAAAKKVEILNTVASAPESVSVSPETSSEI